MECVNLTEWKRTRGIHAQTARRWYRLGTLPVPARNAGRLVLASPQAAAGAARTAEGAGRYAGQLRPAGDRGAAGHRDRPGLKTPGRQKLPWPPATAAWRCSRTVT